jgi:hypothetical protein
MAIDQSQLSQLWRWRDLLWDFTNLYWNLTRDEAEGNFLNCPDNILDLDYLGVYDLVENGTFSFPGEQRLDAKPDSTFPFLK